MESLRFQVVFLLPPFHFLQTPHRALPAGNSSPHSHVHGSPRSSLLLFWRFLGCCLALPSLAKLVASLFCEDGQEVDERPFFLFFLPSDEEAKSSLLEDELLGEFSFSEAFDSSLSFFDFPLFPILPLLASDLRGEILLLLFFFSPRETLLSRFGKGAIDGTYPPPPDANESNDAVASASEAVVESSIAPSLLLRALPPSRTISESRFSK